MAGSRTRGRASMLAILVGGLVLTLGAMIGFTLAFARPLPTAAWVGFGVVVAVAVGLAVVALVLVVRLDERAEAAGRLRDELAILGKLGVSARGVLGADVARIRDTYRLPVTHLLAE